MMNNKLLSLFYLSAKYVFPSACFVAARIDIGWDNDLCSNNGITDALNYQAAAKRLREPALVNTNWGF